MPYIHRENMEWMIECIDEIKFDIQDEELDKAVEKIDEIEEFLMSN